MLELEYSSTIITVYHGTTIEAAHRIVAQGYFEPTTGGGAWLGDGVYFWRDELMAWWWARRKSKKPAVVRATLLLGYTFDQAIAREFPSAFREAQLKIAARTRETGEPMPVNEGQEKHLNCALFNQICEAALPFVDTVSWVFEDGKPYVEGTDLRDRSHSQICVRNANNIAELALVTEVK